jgi:transcriptional regulator with GAF, ATPase, and Fis domain
MRVEAMKRRSRAGGKSVGPLSRKGLKPKGRRPASKAVRSDSVPVRVTEVARLTRELGESLEREAATAEVLQVINASSGDLAPVFDALLEKAMHLCEVPFGHITRFDGEQFHHIATHGDPAFVAFFQKKVLRASTDSITLGRILRGARIVHIPDCRDTVEYREKPIARLIADRGGMCTLLTVALSKNDTLLGTIHVYRQEVRPFSETQIALLQNFAAQAAIAIENARLLNELRQRTADLEEALEQQTATSDVLQVISSSPGDLEPVFARMLENAASICSANFGNIFRWDAACTAKKCGPSPRSKLNLLRTSPPRPSLPSRTRVCSKNCAREQKRWRS